MLVLTAIHAVLDFVKLAAASMAGAKVQKHMDEALYAARGKWEQAGAQLRAGAGQLREKAADLRPTAFTGKKIIVVDKEEVVMKKSTFAAILAFLACAVGVLTAFAIYLYRREKELSEYEELLFEEDFDDEDDEPAEEAAEEEFVMPVPEEAAPAEAEGEPNE